MPMRTYKEFLQILRAIREARHLSQENVAEGMKVDRTGYCRREQGKLDVTVKDLINLANWYGISPSEFFDAAENNSMRAIGELLNTASEADRNKILELVGLAVRGLAKESDVLSETTGTTAKKRSGNKRNQ